MPFLSGFSAFVDIEIPLLDALLEVFFVDVLGNAFGSLGGKLFGVQFELGVYARGEVCHALQLLVLLFAAEIPSDEHEQRFRASSILAVEITAVSDLFSVLAVGPLERVSQDFVVRLVDEARQVSPNAQEHADDPAPDEAEHLDEPHVLPQRFVER